MDNRILDRVKKLLRLAEGTNNANEAAVAAAAAQKLIDEYNLGMVSLDDDDTSGEQTFAQRSADEKIAREEITLDGSKLPRWESALLSSLCRANHARLLYVNQSRYSKNHGYCILGTEIDRSAAIYLFHYLRRQVEEVTKTATNERREVYVPGRTWANNFRLGMVDTIRDRLNESRKALTQGAQQQAYAKGGEAALVRVMEATSALSVLSERVDLEQKHLYRVLGLRQRSTSGGTYDSAAREHGRAAGHGVSLSSGKPLGHG